MKIFAIIVTYNGMKWIDWCLASLQHSTHPITPILVDNGSTDGLREHIPHHHPEAVWLPQDKNLGFGRANNIGIRYAMDHGADAVLLLNQDAAISPDMLAQLVKSDDGNSLLTPIHLNGKGERIDFQFKRSLTQSGNLLLDHFATGHVGDKYPIGMFCAACWYIPVSVLKKAGGFSPLFYHYGEDDNLYNRMMFHGVKSYVIPGVFMYHDREEHGNMSLFNKKKLRREYLVAATNLNLSRKARLNRYYRVWANNKSHTGAFLASTAWMIAHCTEIRRYRQAEAQEGPTWLTTELT